MKKKKRFDCGDEGCGECEVCEYLSFLDWALSVSPGSEIQRNPEIEHYLEKKKTI